MCFSHIRFSPSPYIIEVTTQCFYLVNALWLATWSFSRPSYLKASDLRLLATNITLKPPLILEQSCLCDESPICLRQSAVVARTISMTIEVKQLNLSEVNERNCRSKFATRVMALASSEAIIIELHASAISSHQEVGSGGESLAAFK